MDFSYLGDPRFGVRVYKSSLNEDMANELNECLTHEQSCDRWSLALVGYEQVPLDSYRNCYDFKINEERLDSVQERVGSIYSRTVEQVKLSVSDYSRDYGVQMNFMEAVNFVKYSEGEHFSYHSDHAFHYVCTVSTVAYFNDDYDGGELHFNKLDLKIKPNAGDIIVFPSNFIYSHASLPVTKGTKYAAVTMFDYDNNYSKFRRQTLTNSASH